MVIILVVAVLGGAIWLVQRDRGARGGGRDAAGPVPGNGEPADSSPRTATEFTGAPIPPARLSQGRIVIDGLTKIYATDTRAKTDTKTRTRTKSAVDGLSFTAEPGRVTGFLGPNGAGKTTTLRVLLGLARPTSGHATIGGARYADIDDPIRRVGAVLEAHSAHRGRTGRDHLRVICRAAGLAETRVNEVLMLTGLANAADRKAGAYSLGMRQRLGVAAALLGDPQVLILDEPTNGLDPDGIRWMRGLLRTLADRGRTVLVSSHLLTEMQQLADDLVVIAAGRLLAQGTVQEVVGAHPDLEAAFLELTAGEATIQ